MFVKTTQSTQSWLKEHIGEPQPFNTCNGWGFGGGIGTAWSNDKVSVRWGTAYYRHQNPQAFCTVTVGGVRVYDEPNIGIAELKAIIEWNPS
jgi:hypothetical protein